MDAIWQSISPSRPSPNDYQNIDFWVDPEREGWLLKQGEYIKTWRRRWFVLKQGRLLWFMKKDDVTSAAVPRGVIHVNRCQDVRSAEDAINKPFSFMVHIDNWPIYLAADTDKEKEAWMNSIGRVIVQNSSSVTPEIHDYNQHSPH